jgi:hypothetical protein
MDRYAQQILQAIERDGFYVRVPAGKQFYLYVTQTLDEQDAKIGGSLASDLPPAQSSPTALSSPRPSANLIDANSIPADSTATTSQPDFIP